MSGTNAREEFEEHVKGMLVKCALIHQNYFWSDDDDKKPEITLPLNYTEAQYDSFLEKLNFYYDDGYGTQELFGTIWYTDDSWSSRGEYDGSEWWEHNTLPEIPDYLKGESK